jgi:demethylmenaquinone methyltransferase/2-methoxy-6-polyprenyl-1,4-benzoquinol methylase
MAPPSHLRDQTVQSMFDRIAERYDLLNRVISLRLDARWRGEVIRKALAVDHPVIVDLGTGTGDLALSAAKMTHGEARIVGLDFSLQMIRLAQSKLARSPYGSVTAFVQGSAMNAPFKERSFDAAMTAFVLRNISDLAQFFLEAHRVLKPGGRLVSLDMYPPPPGWFSTLYSIYFHRVMPWIAGWLSHNRGAYQYLSDSVRQFYPPQTIAKLMEEAGFKTVTVRKFLRGAVCMHTAMKAPSAPE